MEATNMKSSEELLREIDAPRAKAYRAFYRHLAILCAIPILFTAGLHLLAVLTQ